MVTLPPPLRAALGLLATALDAVQELVEHAPELPMEAVGNSMQLSMRLQQQYAVLLTRGDEFLASLRGAPEEPPEWATFDDPPPSTSGAGADAADAEMADGLVDTLAEDLPGAEVQDEPRNAGQGDPLFAAVTGRGSGGRSPADQASGEKAPVKKVSARKVPVKAAAKVAAKKAPRKVPAGTPGAPSDVGAATTKTAPPANAAPGKAAPGNATPGTAAAGKATPARKTPPAKAAAKTNPPLPAIARRRARTAAPPSAQPDSAGVLPPDSSSTTAAAPGLDTGATVGAPGAPTLSAFDLVDSSSDLAAVDGPIRIAVPGMPAATDIADVDVFPDDRTARDGRADRGDTADGVPGPDTEVL